MVLELTYSQYNLLWKTSFLALTSFSTAVYNKKYYCSLIPLTVFFTSINYWSRPDYSWRRNIDMVCVKSGIIINIIIAYNSQYYKMYYPVLFLASSCYPISIILYKRKKYWASVYSHAFLHVLGNLSNIILYSGYVLPLNENPLFKRK
jgi:hypothetical protein